MGGAAAVRAGTFTTGGAAAVTGLHTRNACK